jgi:magnesium chelatase accessory protein
LTANSPDPGWNDPLWPFQGAGRYVQAGGARWHLVQLGSGPPILLLHGSASSAHQWAGVAALLQSRFSLVIPDLPGHGYSSLLPPGASGLDGMAAALGALLETEGIRPLLSVGHSAGACIAVRASSRGWIVPRALVGLAPALGSRATYLPRLLDRPMTALTRSGLLARGAARLVRHLPMAEQLLESTGSRVSPEVHARYRALLSDPGRMAGVLALFADWDPDGIALEAARLGVPVTFLAGEKDRWVPPELLRSQVANALAAHPPGRASLELRFLPSLGHLLPEEDPGAVAEAIVRQSERVDSLTQPPGPGPA